MSARPWTVTVAGVVALVEALGVVGFAVLFTADAIPLRDPVAEHLGFAAGIVALCLLGAAALGLGARGLVRGQNWARSLLVVGQLLALAIGVPMVQGGDPVGWLTVALAVVGLVALLHPATTAYLGARAYDSAE